MTSTTSKTVRAFTSSNNRPAYKCLSWGKKETSCKITELENKNLYLEAYSQRKFENSKRFPSSMAVSGIYLLAPHHALSKMAANNTSRKHDITAPSPLILPPKVVNPSASAKGDLWTLTNPKSPRVILPSDVVNPKPSVAFNNPNP